MYIINKKIILFFSIFLLIINGCVAKNDLAPRVKSMTGIAIKNIQKNKMVYNKISSSKLKKENCVDCYATPQDSGKLSLSSNLLLAKVVKKTWKNKVKPTKYFGDFDYKETSLDTTVQKETIVTNYSLPVISSVNRVEKIYFSSTAIQVGAFRKYGGAKVYLKRYDALSNKYKVAIEKGTKNNKPLYRVRIEGFKSRTEANRFMNTYGILDGFLVRK